LSAREVDVAVIGAGAGGMAAALAASLAGLEVVVCEKSGQVGGTAATSAGTLWIPPDTEEAQRYLDALIPEAEGRALRAAYLEAGPRAIRFFEEKSEVRFAPAGMHPDYREAPGAAASGRAIVPLPFDGRLLGADFARVRPPIAEFMLFGGMMIGKADIVTLLGARRSLSHAFGSLKLVARYAADRLRYPRGTRLVMGNALVARLFYSLRNRRVPILFDSPLSRLLREADRITGVLLANGEQITARKGVVLAAGGLGRSDLRRKLMRMPVTDYSLTCTTNTGEGVAAALQAGAGTSTARGGGLWTPVSATGRKAADGFFPHLILDRAKPGLIAVDAAGRRFVNEACSYHDFVEAMFDAKAIPAYLVCDATFVRRYGLGMVHPRTRNPRKYGDYLACGDTLDELARAAGIDAAGLKRSVERHNAFAKSGVDEDFGKGKATLDRFNGDPAFKNPCLGAIGDPPYCALKVWPGDLGTSDGLAANENAQVLDEAGRPVGGLYACGNDMASIFRGTYPGPGITLGPALVFGYLAAQHLSKQ